MYDKIIINSAERRYTKIFRNKDLVVYSRRIISAKLQRSAKPAEVT